MSETGLNWRGAARIGPAWAVFLGAAGDNALHSHHAIQAFAGPHAVITGPAGQVEASGFVVPANISHRAAATHPSAFLYLDPDTDTGRRVAVALNERILTLNATEAAALANIVEDCVAGKLADPAAALAGLLGAGSTPPHCDGRVSAALVAFHEGDAPLDAHTLARAIGLSPSRVAHLFRKDVGIPMRSFLLWSKLRRAFSAVAEGQSLTEAAHLGGFADSAHFSRTCVCMFGASPLAITGAVAFDR